MILEGLANVSKYGGGAGGRSGSLDFCQNKESSHLSCSPEEPMRLEFTVKEEPRIKKWKKREEKGPKEPSKNKVKKNVTKKKPMKCLRDYSRFDQRGRCGGRKESDLLSSSSVG